VVVILGSILIFGATAVLAFFSRPERVAAITAQAQVNADGSAQITETIGYRFAGFNKHGIFRDVPGLSTTAPVHVADDGQSTPVLVSSTVSGLTHIRIGNPARTVTGDHVYQVSYPLPTLLAGNELAWNGVGTAWIVPIDRVALDVSAPWSWTNLRCDQGTSGSTGGCEVSQPQPGLLEVRTTDLDAHEGVTVRAEKGAPLAQAPPLPAPGAVVWPPLGSSPFVPAATAGLLALLAGLVIRRILRRAGREEVIGQGATDVAFADGTSGAMRRIDSSELAEMASIEFAPPKELTAWQGGIVNAEEVEDRHKVAWLLEAAIDGYLTLDDQDGISLHRAEHAPDATTAVLDIGFAGRPDVTLGKYDPSFASMWGLIDRQLQDWSQNSELWDPAGRRNQRRALVLGVLAVVAGAIIGALGTLAVVGQGTAWIPVVAAGALLAGAGIAAVSSAFELLVRTPQGSGLWIRVESFRRFLHDSEGPQAEEAAKRGVLRQYTAWAIALDEVQHWSKAVKAAGTSISSIDRSGLGYVYLAPVLMQTAHATSVAPSSSGVGGGGGGAGGGFGGGGGGSW
jgi:hypothetical protein